MAATPGPVTNLTATAIAPTSVTLSWTQATQLVVTPGLGSFLDNAGNTWAVNAAGAVVRNAKAVPGGSGTSALTYVSSTNTIYGQDAASKAWYSWNGSSWTKTSGTPVKTLVGAVYSVKYRVTGTSPWTTFGTTTQGSSLKVTGLVPHTKYDMEVITTGGH